MSQAAEPGPDWQPESWQRLRTLTAARIALGHAGAGLPTQQHLAFQLAHAQARDAVHVPLDLEALDAALLPLSQPLGLARLRVQSRAGDRLQYLQRPDWGRRLKPDSVAELASHTAEAPELVFVLADGLSALALQRHAAALLAELLPRLPGLRLGPLVLAEQARVALGDEVGEALGAELVVVLIGERPGLSSPDSLGLYLTWQPRVGTTDERRNCVSNIRPEGLGYGEAAAKAAWLIQTARARQLSGVALKDEMKPLLSETIVKEECGDVACLAEKPVGGESVWGAGRVSGGPGPDRVNA